jgi:hypothetical protein
MGRIGLDRSIVAARGESALMPRLGEGPISEVRDDTRP